MFMIFGESLAGLYLSPQFILFFKKKMSIQFCQDDGRDISKEQLHDMQKRYSSCI